MTNENGFPDSPDWNKVERFSNIIINILNNNKLTFTERQNILTLVQSVITKEFNMVGVINFLDGIAKKEELLDLQKTQHVYQ